MNPILALLNAFWLSLIAQSFVDKCNGTQCCPFSFLCPLVAEALAAVEAVFMVRDIAVHPIEYARAHMWVVAIKSSCDILC